MPFQLKTNLPVIYHSDASPEYCLHQQRCSLSGSIAEIDTHFAILRCLSGTPDITG